MTIEALIVGKLHGSAQRRTAATSGRAFVSTKVRTAGEGEAVFVNVVAFSESAGAALLALSEGDSLALAGTLKPGAWTDREGHARPQLDMVAAQVLTLYALKRRRAAAQPDDKPAERQLETEDRPHTAQSRAQRQPPRAGIRPPADWDTGRNLADMPDDLP